MFNFINFLVMNNYWLTDFIYIEELMYNKKRITLYYGKNRCYSICTTIEGDNIKQGVKLLKDSKKDINPVHGLCQYV